VTGAYVATGDEAQIVITGISAPFSITLADPKVVGPTRGTLIKDESGLPSSVLPVTILPPGGFTIDGGASLLIATAYGDVTVYSSGSNWFSGSPGASMTTRNVVNIIGTETVSGVTVANNTSDTSAQQDVLTNNTSIASMSVYVAFTSTATIGTVDVSLQPLLNAGGQVYSDDAPLICSVTPKVGTTRLVVNLPASLLPAARFFKVNVLNNGTGADITDVYVGAEVYVQT
jgi:hypothetical protein